MIHIKRPYQQPEQLPLAEVHRQLAAGELNGDELAWQAGMNEWQALASVPGAISPTPPPLPPDHKSTPQRATTPNAASHQLELSETPSAESEATTDRSQQPPAPLPLVDPTHSDSKPLRKTEQSPFTPTHISDGFGLNVDNPIPSKGIPESYTYLGELATPDLKRITYERLGSFDSKATSRPVDKYQLFDSAGRPRYQIDGEAVDLAVVDQFYGPTIPAPWLEFGKFVLFEPKMKVSACWLAGQKLDGIALPR